MKVGFAVRLASTVAAAILAWPPTEVLALSTTCTGTSQVFEFNGTDNSTGTIQTFTVPVGVFEVTIDAAGAAGGSTYVTHGPAGGLGAELAASFAVTPHETLNALVGGVGGGGYIYSGGGGGSFVYRSPDAAGLLIAAAGGGGASIDDPGDAGNAGNAAGNGNGFNSGTGGTLGQGGEGGHPGGGGGGGLLGNGGDGGGYGGGHGGMALANGGAGGAGSSSSRGGFGGGGAGSQPFYDLDGGGGGGYNGGGGGGQNGGGGGGGSYSATATSVSQSGVQSGNGEVSFCFTTFAGKPGFSNCHGVSVSALSIQFGNNLGAAAAALHFPSVPALQAAITAYCGS